MEKSIKMRPLIKDCNKDTLRKKEPGDIGGFWGIYVQTGVIMLKHQH